MGKVHLSLACGDYEITRSLAEGTTTPDGIELTVLTEDPERIFRLDRRNECDISEFNVVQYLKSRDKNDDLLAIPVFPHRRFRHGSIFVNSNAGIKAPQDLIGRSVGIGGFEPAAAIWIRGTLQDQYGVKLHDVDWQDVFGILGRLPDSQSKPANPKDANSRFLIDELLTNGALAGLVSAYFPPAFLAGDHRIDRLFPDYQAVESDYFRTSGIFPIMHLITIKAEVVDKNPWIPSSLMAAFSASKRKAMERLRNPRVAPMAFWQSSLETQTELMGPDPWEYGLTPGNRKALQTVARYAAEQGITSRELDIEKLFLTTDDFSAESIAII
ncbi:hypothetical protein [Arthrobacter sp. MA-N2]|uniref:hypothetical protein n=1 Tax=Arthrobacter sp. MA-N2 TaxID=1101188 RepID=UPI0004845E1C|nr:hypothetical protein [Arthrobacter sp. MA-N2]